MISVLQAQPREIYINSQYGLHVTTQVEVTPLKVVQDAFTETFFDPLATICIDCSS